MTILRYDTLLRAKFAGLLTEYFEELNAQLPHDIILERILPMFEIQDHQRIGTIVLALHRGKPMGFAIYQIDSPRSDWCKYPGWGCIREFYIRPEFRHKGFGRRLAAYAESHLKKLGATDVYLTADSAVNFWEHCGYSNTHEICSNDLEILTKIL